MKKKSKLKKFDPVDFLTDEESLEEYIIALIEEGASEALMQSAYKDVERARVVHGIPKPETPAAAPVLVAHAGGF